MNSLVFFLISLAVVSSWPNSGPNLSGRRRRGLRLRTAANTDSCGLGDEFATFLDELDLGNILSLEASWDEIPDTGNNGNGNNSRQACKNKCKKEPGFSATRKAECKEACDCKWDCLDGTPAASLGVLDFVFEACENDFGVGNPFCTEDCLGRCRGTYNHYELTVEGDAAKYFAGNSTQECVLLGDEDGCDEAAEFWSPDGSGVVCTDFVDPVTQEVIFECFCQSEAPSESPTDQPSAEPSASPSAVPSASPTEGDCQNICDVCGGEEDDGLVINGVLCCTANTPSGGSRCKGTGGNPKTLTLNPGEDLCCQGQGCKNLDIAAPATLNLIQCEGSQACKFTDFAGAAAANVCCIDPIQSCVAATGFGGSVQRFDYP